MTKPKDNSVPIQDQTDKPTGRPPEYKKEFCDDAIEYMGSGKTITQFAVKCKVTRVALYQWKERHPEFKEAMAVAQEAHKAWWEEMFQAAAVGVQKGVVPSMMIFKMKQLDWSDKSVVETTTKEIPYNKSDVDNVIDNAV